MVGGTVIEVVDCGDRLWINCQSHLDQCAVYIEKKEDVQPGDKMWWQAGVCYWTPIDNSRIEVRIKKLGFSGVSRPELKHQTGGREIAKDSC